MNYNSTAPSPSPSAPPLYNNGATKTSTEYSILIPYQIDFHTETVGKHISITKRICVWRFGFAHIPSLLSLLNNTTTTSNDDKDDHDRTQGHNGEDESQSYRGMELEVKFIWSIASGKHELYVNNMCISSSTSLSASSTGNNTFKFDHAFNVPQRILPGGHILHITLHNQPLQLQQSKIYPQRQFILRLDGQRFHNFYKIYQLGGQPFMDTYRYALEKIKLNQEKNGFALQ